MADGTFWGAAITGADNASMDVLRLVPSTSSTLKRLEVDEVVSIPYESTDPLFEGDWSHFYVAL